MIVFLSSHGLDLSPQLAGRVCLVADGKVESGSADHLIRSGSIARALDTIDVAFSPACHRFEPIEHAGAAA